MNEWLASAIIQAGVTGAGLVFVLYTLILSNRSIFRYSLESVLIKKAAEIGRLFPKVREKPTTEGFEKLKKVATEAAGESPPLWSRTWAGLLTFGFFIVSVILSTWWLFSDETSRKGMTEIGNWAFGLFLGASGLFALIGLAVLTTALEKIKGKNE